MITVATKPVPLVLVDLDNTLALPGSRDTWDASTCVDDQCNTGLQFLLNKMDNEVYILTARPEVHRSPTEMWLSKYKIRYDKLIMKPLDQRVDGISAAQYKIGTVMDMILQNPMRQIIAFEDDDEICREYRDMGVYVIQLLPLS